MSKPQGNKVMSSNSQNNRNRRSRSGIVLLITLVLLVVLSAMGYVLTARVAAQRHRERYMIDYANARYACDSLVKYAIATLGDINIPPLIVRANEPDFSDTFAMTEDRIPGVFKEVERRKSSRGTL